MPDPEIEPYWAIGLAFILHDPFFIGPTIANEIVMFSVPLTPEYAFVPLTTGTGSVMTKVAEQVVEFIEVGGVLLLFTSLPSWVVLRRIVPFFKFSSLYVPFLVGAPDEFAFVDLPESPTAPVTRTGPPPPLAGVPQTWMAPPDGDAPKADTPPKNRPPRSTGRATAGLMTRSMIAP